jgi:hypothetical protein
MVSVGCCSRVYCRHARTFDRIVIRINAGDLPLAGRPRFQKRIRGRIPCIRLSKILGIRHNLGARAASQRGTRLFGTGLSSYPAFPGPVESIWQSLTADCASTDSARKACRVMSVLEVQPRKSERRCDAKKYQKA